MSGDWQHLWSSTDNILYFIMATTLVLFLGVTVAMISFVIRCDHKRHPVAEQISGSTVLEIIWTLIPTLLVLTIFWVGWKGFIFLHTVPDEGAKNVIEAIKGLK